MKLDAARLDTVFMVRATDQAESYYMSLLDRALSARDDTRHAERIARGECRTCFYLLGRAGGASCTSRPCAGACGATITSGNTSIDVLCLACANAHSLCKRCGGDREMRVKRRKWPTFARVAPDGDA